MLVVFPFCHTDKHLAVRLAAWINELGGVKAHDCLLAIHKDTDSVGVIEPLTEAFGRVAEFAVLDDMIVERDQHTYAANLMWKRTVNHVADMTESQPFLWMEPDSVPVPPNDRKKNWLDMIAAVYQEGEKPFMHCLVSTTRGKSNSGCGVYPAKIRDFTDRLWELSNISWDVLLFEDFSKHTNYTALIQDQGFMHDGETLPTFPDNESLAMLRPATVLFHRCKDGTLIERLREERQGRKRVEPIREVPNAQPAYPILDFPAPSGKEAELMDRIARLEALLQRIVLPPIADPPPPPKGSGKAKPKRTKAQQAAIDARMAKLRDRKKKLTGVL